MMDSELVMLASTGATTVVALMATDAWEQARAAMVSLWQRVHPDRVATLEAQLAEGRSALLAARETGEDTVPQALVSEWNGRIGRLLAVEPQAAGYLRQLIDEQLTPALAAVGGDQHIAEGPVQ
ncbi:hypothetical protein GXW83_14305 [Streptacidiphilus sp. PB12-B1b]|uniref:hypothetical protein n=1 Tax=Streptacidiphilus sp. PB12-B1b TaxID=2705012 RepID=UPI0015F8DA3A|nr:hypothetical protein [Streptacidiphilus sp. PB12-B1b]QMU76738.1 hypothetical protein GXW83_14305 [Streptacidiphilus sp. PB12-B1b]